MSFAPPSAVADKICFLRAHGGRQAKFIDSEGRVYPPDESRTFDAQEIPIADLNALLPMLARAAAYPDICAVRGHLIDGPARKEVRRLVHDKPGCPATLRDAPRRWVAVDVDGVGIPAETRPDDLLGCAEAAVAVLPREFQHAGAIVQATGSHGLKPGARLRLWYWLSRPVANAELKAWLVGCPAVDHSAFNAAQPIFTAAPVFERGRPDHLATRIAVRPGAPVVVVPEIAVTIRQDYAAAAASQIADVSDVAAALEVIPNPDAPWESWSHTGMAAYAASAGGEAGLAAWSAWSAKSTKHDPAACRERWDHWHSSPPQALTFGTLVHLAQEAAPGWRAPSWGPMGGGSIEDAQAVFQAAGIVPIAVPRQEAEAASAATVVAFSDDALALRFASEYGGRFCYAVGLHEWLEWDGARFRKDSKLMHMTLARETCRREAALVPDSDAGLARKLSSAQTRSAVLAMAASDPVFARDVDEFDADAWLLNTPAGVVDLKSGGVIPRDPSGLFTKVTKFAPGGDCPRWRQFLHEITQGNDEVVSFLQRFIGYTLTGVVDEHAFVFLYGPGGNGKSLLLNTVAGVLGDYATPAMSDVFTAHRNEQHPTHLANLRGARMVVVGETEEGVPWAEARLKSLTGGDRVSARVMRGDPFEFTPAFKLWIAGNHRPTLKNPDDAMRRRLHMVPLTFRPPTPDTGLAAALLAEGPGILAWAVAGCLAWQRLGLCPPPAVRDATADYFADQDSLAAWLAERCEAAAGAQAQSSDLYADWATWAGARGVPPRGDKWFSPALERHHAKVKTRTGMQFTGIALRHRTGGMLADVAASGL